MKKKLRTRNEQFAELQKCKETPEQNARDDIPGRGEETSEKLMRAQRAVAETKMELLILEKETDDLKHEIDEVMKCLNPKFCSCPLVATHLYGTLMNTRTTYTAQYLSDISSISVDIDTVRSSASSTSSV